MINDKAIEYNSKVIKIERLIENLKNIGINTEKYENELKSIKESLLNEHSKSTSNKYFGIENDYIGAMSKLNKLEAHLNEYMVYFKAYNFTIHLREDIKTVEEDKLSFYIDELIKLLKEIKASSTLIYDKEKEIIENLYKVTYYLLLEENKHLTEYKLYNVVSKSEVDLYYLDKILLSDIESISDKEALKKVKSEIHLMNLKGNEAHYITEDIIKSIIYAKYGDDLRDKTTEELNKIAKEIENNTVLIKRSKRKIEIEMSTIDKLKESIKDFKKELAKQIASMGVNIAALTFTLGLTPFIISRFSAPKTYKYTYNLDGNIIEEIDEGYNDEINNYYKGKVIIKEPYTISKSGQYNYTYREYTFEEDEFNDVLNAVKNGKELNYTEKKGEYTSLEAASAPQETTTVIEVTKQDKDDCISIFKQDEAKAIFVSIFGGLFLTAIIYLPFELSAEMELGIGLCEKIPELKELIEEFVKSENVKKLKDQKLDVALMNAELMKLIQNDNELREKFMRIYKANESLIIKNKEEYEELLSEQETKGQTLTLK